MMYGSMTCSYGEQVFVTEGTICVVKTRIYDADRDSSVYDKDKSSTVQNNRSMNSNP